jgi:biotin carboxyl carrier protein
MDREFSLNVDGTEYEIEIHGNSLLVDGQPFVIGMENGLLTVDGIVYDLTLGDRSAIVDGKEYRVEAAGMLVHAAVPRKAAPRKRRAAVAAGSVTAVMPGTILRLLVSEGDQIQEGEVVAILEAMKMENEIQAHRSGVIAKVYVAPGDSVETGQALIEIE